jgi:hypothetical protein
VFAQEASGSALPSLLFLALMVGVFYFLIIRPQRKRTQAQRDLAKSLQIGDEVRGSRTVRSGSPSGRSGTGSETKSRVPEAP